MHYFPVPAFFDYAETKEAMWRERSVRRVLAQQRRADIALFSVGALSGGLPSHVYTAGYLEASDVAVLDHEGVVGDVCTVFLREDGTYKDVALNARATGPSPSELRRVPRRVCAVAGDNKVVPLRAALRARVVTAPHRRRGDGDQAARGRLTGESAATSPTPERGSAGPRRRLSEGTLGLADGVSGETGVLATP